MLGKLHLISRSFYTEGFHAKIRCNLNFLSIDTESIKFRSSSTTFHTSVKRREIPFNSYNYNFFHLRHFIPQ